MESEGGGGAAFETNRRADDLVEMQLPCRVVFPSIWSGSQDGLTANLHKSGLLVDCRVKEGRPLPAPGTVASVRIALPRHHNFPRKYMCCDTTLLGVEKTGERQYIFALQIVNVDFADVCAHSDRLMDLDSESCGYIM